MAGDYRSFAGHSRLHCVFTLRGNMMLSTRLRRLILLATGWAANSAALADPAAATAAPPTFLEVANLAHYAAANAVMPAPRPGERRVVFMGDSITESWLDADPGYFAADGAIARIDRGISGQTSAQMLLRFQQDVIALHPTAVHILAGTNDVAANWGSMPLEATELDIASMAELARANGIRVMIGSVLPVRDFPWRPGLEPGPKIVALNDWLRDYCRRHGHVYIDYYSLVTDGALGMRPNLASDGVHPTPAGYAVMKGAADAAIRHLLGGT
jgi:lysophospholipase L1-like esterase